MASARAGMAMMASCPAITREDVLLSALDLLDHHRALVRAGARKAINDTLPDGVTLGEFVGELMRQAAGKRPWWQLQATWILGHKTIIRLLSQSSFALCERLSTQIEPPSLADADTLGDLHYLYSALFDR
jgi:hypothetical protein